MAAARVQSDEKIARLAIPVRLYNDVVIILKQICPTPRGAPIAVVGGGQVGTDDDDRGKRFAVAVGQGMTRDKDEFEQCR